MLGKDFMAIKITRDKKDIINDKNSSSPRRHNSPKCGCI